MHNTRHYMNIWQEHRHYGMYTLHRYVCVTSVLYICHKEGVKHVVIFLLDGQMNV